MFSKFLSPQEEVETVTVLGPLLRGNTLEEEEPAVEERYTPGSARLPTSLRPVHYTIRLQPFINGNLSIHGSVDIRLKVVQPTDKVVLNMADIITRNESVTVIILSYISFLQ